MSVSAALFPILHCCLSSANRKEKQRARGRLASCPTCPDSTLSPSSTADYCQSKFCEGRGRVTAERMLHEVRHTQVHTCTHLRTHTLASTHFGTTGRGSLSWRNGRRNAEPKASPQLRGSPLASALRTVASLCSRGLTRPLGTCPSLTGAHASPLPPVSPQAPCSSLCAKPVRGLEENGLQSQPGG